MNIDLTMITPDWVTAIATIILVLATCIYVYFSYKLTKETIKLREVETSPFISIIFEGNIIKYDVSFIRALKVFFVLYVCLIIVLSFD